MSIIVHVNPRLPHQTEHGEWFKEGFRRVGLRCEVTTDPLKNGDIHIVSGPHYVRNYWPNTLLLDRAYYMEVQKPPGMASMPCVSLGWFYDGRRHFKPGSGRKPPEKKDPPGEGGTIFLADYNGKVERADTVRLHPANQKHEESLKDVLRKHRRAVGYQTTALVAAGLEGLEVICKDERSIMSHSNWLELLPYADWSYEEIKSGEAIDFLWQQL